MKINDILTEAEQQDLEKSLDTYFKKRDLEKKRKADMQAKPKPVARAAEPEGDDPYSRTLSKLNAPKDKVNRDEFRKAFKRGWDRGEEFKQGVKQAYNKVTSHKLFQPK